MLLLDQNLSPKLAGILGIEFGIIVHVDTLGMAGDSDTCVWEYAKKNGYAIVTKDKDFYQRSTLVGHPPKVIHLTLGNCSVAETATALFDRSGRVKDFLKHPSKAYLVLP